MSYSFAHDPGKSITSGEYPVTTLVFPVITEVVALIIIIITIIIIIIILIIIIVVVVVVVAVVVVVVVVVAEVFEISMIIVIFFYLDFGVNCDLACFIFYPAFSLRVVYVC